MQPQPQQPPGAYYGQPQGQCVVYPPPQQPTTVVVVNQAPQSFVGHIVLSCFVFWCCGWLFGLIAFILAMVANAQARETPESARQLGRASIGVSIAGIVVTVIIIIIVVVYFTVFAHRVVSEVGSLSSVEPRQCDEGWYRVHRAPNGSCWGNQKHVDSSSECSYKYSFYSSSQNICYYD